MSKRRHLYQSKHPFDFYPFEAVLFGSWKPVEQIRIQDGTMSTHFSDNKYVTTEKVPSSDMRIRSRKATVSDCLCFLRPGIDICVLSTSRYAQSPKKSNTEPVWVDARICSIERKPHDLECSCQFFVNLYVKQGSLGAEIRSISKEIKVVGINQISILQKLEKHPCEHQHYRWSLSEDCTSLPETKLLLGKLLSDLSWLIVASLVKHIAFIVRSVGKKIVYEILGGDDDKCSSGSDSYRHSINFKVENGMLLPEIALSLPDDSNKLSPTSNSPEAGPISFYDPTVLRRSKRRNVQPDRYLGYDDASETDIGYIRTRPYKIDQWEDEDALPLSCLFNLPDNHSQQHIDSEQRVKRTNTGKELLVYNRKSKSRELKTVGAEKIEQQDHLAIVPVPNESDKMALEHLNFPAKVPVSHANRSGTSHSKSFFTKNGSKVLKKGINLLTLEPHNFHGTDLESNKSNVGEISSRFYDINETRKGKRKSDLDDIEFECRPEGYRSSRKVPRKRYKFFCSNGRSPGRDKNYKDRSFNASAYKELIDSFLKNMDTTPNEEEQNITEQWNQFKETSRFEQKRETETAPTEPEEEMSEIDMLWKEMELALASSYLDDIEGSSAAKTVHISSESCQHDYRLDEEIGIICHKCGSVSSEIKDVFPPFMRQSVLHSEEKHYNEEEEEVPVHEPHEDEDLRPLPTHAAPETPLYEEEDNVWALIPDLRRKLHVHQKKAFEFLWKNIGGSMEPASMEKASKKTGGCVVSHTPGAGKTFLIIAFLVSYLKLFPGKRPLVLAPKTTLYTWYKEFIKWKIPIPVYLIHGRRTYRVFKQKKEMDFPGVPKPTDDVRHVLDCLEKIQKWHSHPSVLVMGYSSFLTLMREDSKYSHRKYMAKVLRESPGILVLDEGHNPRSTKSRLRKVLMKVETDLRVLLSGTLFQNNFCEYFNTLCLARPRFIHEVLKLLDPKYKKVTLGAKLSRSKESRARKHFLDIIAKKIDSSEGEERMQGLNMLRNMTSRFIDVYEGGSSDNLPGLQIYTLLMNSTDIQHEILDKLEKIMATYNGYPLELELLITLGSIHPWLVKTSNCANKFLTTKELVELEKSKFDLKKGSKVRFVLSLVYRIFKKEKVLIFCHNIAPMKLFLDLFEKYFGWQKGREVLAITGDLELFERGRVMDRFEEPGGPSRVLIASITACAEGISLTAASRVIMLDSEWNPSKTKQAIARAFRPGQQKMVYVYQLLATGTLEEGKYRRTTWKEWVSSMIFSEAFVEDPSKWQAEKIEDDILREMVEEDRSKSFHMIMKNEKASTN